MASQVTRFQASVSVQTPGRSQNRHSLDNRSQKHTQVIVTCTFVCSRLWIELVVPYNTLSCRQQSSAGLHRQCCWHARECRRQLQGQHTHETPARLSQSGQPILPCSAVPCRAVSCPLTFLHRCALVTCSASSTEGLEAPAAAAAAGPSAAPAAAVVLSCCRPSMRLKMPSASLSMNSSTLLNTAPEVMLRVLLMSCSVSP